MNALSAKAAIARYAALLFLFLCLADAILSEKLAAMVIPSAIIPQATSEPVTTQFYKSLVAGIGAARGKLSFRLQPGTTVTRTANTKFDIRWIVQAGTEVKVSFNYQDGVEQGWQSLNMDFKPRPLIVSFREGTVFAKRHQITRIEFRRSGEPKEYYDESGHPVGAIGLALSQFPEVREHLRIPQGPLSLFLGKPFAGLTASPSPRNAGLFVREVSIPKSIALEDVPTVTLKPQAVITLAAGRGGSSKNWIQLRQASVVTIPSLSYSPDGSLVDGMLGPLSFTVSDGYLGVSPTAFYLDSGVSLRFDGLLFTSVERPGNVPSVQAIRGRLAGRLKNDSRIEVARTTRGSSLFRISIAEPVDLKGLQLIYRENLTRTMEVESASIPLADSQGELPFDDKNYFQLRFSSTPSLRLSANRCLWDSDQKPVFSGEIPAFTADVKGGQMVLNSRSTLRISAGRVTTSGILLDSANPRPVRAAFSEAAFALAAGSSLGVADQLTVSASSGTLTAATSAQPLSFDPRQEGPAGNLSLRDFNITQGNMKLGSQGSVTLDSGSISAAMMVSLQRGLSGTLTGVLGARAGSFELDETNRYAIQRGTMRFNQLSLSDASGLNGPFQSVEFILAQSSARFSEKLTAVITNSGSLKAADARAPFTIHSSANVTGNCALRLPISQGKLQLGALTGIDLQTGTIEVPTINLGNRPLSGQIRLDAMSNGGTFVVNDATTLRIAQGRVQATELSFRNPSTLSGAVNSVALQLLPSAIKLPNALTAQLTAGGTLNAGDNSTALQIKEDGQVTGDYRLQLPVQSGRMILGKIGSVELTGGRIDLAMARNAGRTPTVAAAVDVAIGGGEVELFPGARVTLNGNSRLKAETLSVSSTNGFAGALTTLEFTLGASEIAIPGGFRLKTKSGGRLTVEPSTTPLTVSESGSFPQGNLVLDLPFHDFFNAQDASVHLTDGNAHLPLQIGSEGNITGSDCSISGTLFITFSNPPSPAFDLPIAISLTNGSLLKRSGNPAHFSANLSASIPSGITIPITTRADDPPGNAYVFSVKLAIATVSAVNLTGTITLDGPSASVPTITQTANLNIQVNAPRQEIFTDTFCSPFSCRLHIYLVPHTYAATANLTVGLDANGTAISIGNLQLAESVQWERDGCGGCKVLGDIVAFFGGKDSPVSIIEQKMREKIAGFQYTLRR